MFNKIIEILRIVILTVLCTGIGCLIALDLNDKFEITDTIENPVK